MPATVTVDGVVLPPAISALPNPVATVLRMAPVPTVNDPGRLWPTVKARLAAVVAVKVRLPPERMALPVLTENLGKLLPAPLSVHVPEPRLSILPVPVI